MKRFLIILVGLLLVASTAAASDWAQRVSSLTQGQGQLERVFDGPEGMTGIIIGPTPGSVDNGKILAWGTPSGLLLIGNVYDRNGRNLSDVVRQDRPEWFQSQVSQGPVEHSGDPFWDEAATFVTSGRAVVEGQGERIYVFTESTCGYCQKFYHEVHADPIFLKRFEVVWVPVTRDGKNLRTGAILNGDMGILTDKGKPVQVSKAQEQFVLDNTYFLQDNGGRLSTPSFLIRKNGKAEFVYGQTFQTLQTLLGS